MVDRSVTWATRIMHEAQLHADNCFLTLTYSPEHIPANNSLDLADWQYFAKQLRRKAGPFRYFHCGEYGEEGRPHYHAAIFGHSFWQDRKYFHQSKAGEKLYRSELLESCWTKGFADIGELNHKSAAYVARYIFKKQQNKFTPEFYRDGRKREYVTMSRRPGLGRDWLHKYRTDLYPSDFCVVEGRKAKVPRFYDLILKDEDPELWNSIHNKRQKEGDTHWHENTPKRLKAREAVLHAKLSTLKREL